MLEHSGGLLFYLLEACDLNYEEHKSEPKRAQRCPLLRPHKREQEEHSSQEGFYPQIDFKNYFFYNFINEAN